MNRSFFSPSFSAGSNRIDTCLPSVENSTLLESRRWSKQPSAQSPPPPNAFALVAAIKINTQDTAQPANDRFMEPPVSAIRELYRQNGAKLRKNPLLATIGQPDQSRDRQ